MDHVHFDEEKFERDLRATFAQTQADPALHTDGSVVLNRNQEVSIQLGMLVCREFNRGTSVDDIMAAGAHAFIEFFSNVIAYVDETDRDEWGDDVASDLVLSMIDVLENREGTLQIGVPAIMQEIKGGRA